MLLSQQYYKAVGQDAIALKDFSIEFRRILDSPNRMDAVLDQITDFIFMKRQKSRDDTVYLGSVVFFGGFIFLFDSFNFESIHGKLLKESLLDMNLKMRKCMDQILVALGEQCLRHEIPVVDKEQYKSMLKQRMQLDEFRIIKKAFQGIIQGYGEEVLYLDMNLGLYLLTHIVQKINSFSELSEVKIKEKLFEEIKNDACKN